MPKTVNTNEMSTYLRTGYTLIPLYKWDSTSTFKGKTRQDGKRPLSNDWTTRLYKSEDTVAKSKADNNNAGVRLTSSQLVIDVDPRNSPMDDDTGEQRDTFKELCKALSIDPTLYPKVNTGSGGFHLYMQKDPDVPVIDTLEGYEGVEFKTRGRQVVAAGSVHPNGNKYYWDDTFQHPELEDAPFAPSNLMAMIKRPTQPASSGGKGGEYSDQDIAKMLNELDPVDFGSAGASKHGVDWLKLMMAVHHASDGEARDEWLEWCSRDPEYADDSWIVGRRWDSLHRAAPDGTQPVTHKTLGMLMLKEGKQGSMPARSDAADDFDDEYTGVELDPGDQDEVEKHEKKGAMTLMNEKYWAVKGGKFRIMHKAYDPVQKRHHWESQAFEDFKKGLANKKIEKVNAKGESVPTPIADAWLEWPGRRSVSGVIFDPEQNHKGFLNLWSGWGVDPAPGSWETMKYLIKEILCAGDEVSSEFCLNWIAYMFQHPGTPPEVALCFRGDKGTGKSTLGQALVQICGTHGLHVTSPDHVTGRFNHHLMDCIFLFADEAIAPADVKSQAALKSLITDTHKVYEQKGMDLKPGLNRVHVMMCSNNDWFVDAGTTDGERRYFVGEVSNNHRQDRKFFAKFHYEMYENGQSGLRAMLHDLLARDITDWAPRGEVPVSKALVDQKLQNLDPMGRWWFSLLDNAELGDIELVDNDANWVLDEEVRVIREDVRTSFDNYCLANGIRGKKQMERFFWKELKAYCPLLDTAKQVRVAPGPERFDVTVSASDKRTSGIWLPSLASCRAELTKLLGAETEWAVE
jgi:hypothetical protein